MLGGLWYWDDLVETWIKLRQRGIPFILSKLHWKNNRRTLSSFQNDFMHSNWWIIPAIQKRMNKKISGHENTSYEEYITKKYLIDTEDKVLISIGCGTGSHEIKLASLNPHLHVKAYDLSEALLQEARDKAIKADAKNISFIKADAYTLLFADESVDYFLFNASLHHLQHIDSFLQNKIVPALKENGLVILNEYAGPNRMNFHTGQIKKSSALLNYLPEEKKKIAFTGIIKTRSYRLGKWRMLFSDPSECVESENILPAVHTHFIILEEKPLGGNLLMPALKHIAHHFLSDDKELEKLFYIEDEYLKENKSDYVFGVYGKRGR